MKQHLLATDHSACWSEDGRMVPCEGAGQDASHRNRDPSLHRKRFQVLDQVIRDDVTGAVWTRDANPAEFPLTWQEAMQFTADMRRRQAHGYDDWNLPSRRLLFAMISHQYINPALPAGHPFVNVFNGYYWTRETCSRLPDQAWYGHLGGGRIHRGMKHGSYMVWPVSRGEAADGGSGGSGTERFRREEDGIHDALTSLTWSADADPFVRPLSWTEALSSIQAFNGRQPDGRSAWRLPNIRELESLVDLESHSPALTAPHPFVNVPDACWSSTTSAYEPRYAWTLYFQDGTVGVGFKPGAEFYAWPVRGG